MLGRDLPTTGASQIGTQDGWGRATTQYMQNGQGLKSPLPSHCRGGGWQYKKYNSVIFGSAGEEVLQGHSFF
jgi:hypothetical protein